MRLTAENDPESIQRYAHLRRARGLGVQRCHVPCHGLDRQCTLEAGHRGPHVAHDWRGRVRAVWDGGRAVAGGGGTGRGSTPAAPREARPGRSDPQTDAPSALALLARGLGRRFSSVEDVVMLILFLAFLGFAVDWFLRMLG